MLKHTPEYLMSKATTLQTKLGGRKKMMAAQTKSNCPGKRTLYPIARHREFTPLFILFPGLFEIIVQSTLGTAILFY